MSITSPASGSTDTDRPLALAEGLVTDEVDGELLVYDAARGLACRLNASAALVWHACDGERTSADLVNVLAHELGPHADEDLVLIALDDLVQHGLITSYGKRQPSAARLSRRRLLRRVGLAGATAITLPVVYGTAPPVLAHSVEARGAQADF